MARSCWVYILSSRTRRLYVGVTSDLPRRWAEHQRADGRSFVGRYRVLRLVFVEESPSPRAAIAREKQLKRWRREKKLWLIAQSNPAWDDLAEQWGWSVGEGADPSTSRPFGPLRSG
jgi:putative endonuclease